MSTPTAYTTGGGGFFTMTSSMGIIRAWHESNLLNDTTHFGGGSGGTWFQLQFSFSKDFYESAIGLNGDTVPDFLTAWGTSYGESMVAASESGLFEEILEFTLATSSNKCVLDGLDVGNLTAADIITGALREALESLYFPANNWYFYINEMLGTYIPDAETVDFSTERKGFPKGTIVIGSTLGPDIYQNDPSSKSPKLIGAPAGVTLLPISYVAPADSDGSWDSQSTVSGRGGGGKPTPSSTSDAGRAIKFVAFLILSISMLVSMIGLEGQM